MASSSNEFSPAVAVIGGGATGLSAACQLHRQGVRVRLFEAKSRVGGNVGSGQADGWLWEAGPNSLQENSRTLVELLGSIGLAGERIEASTTSKKRFIVRNGKLCPIPMSPGALLSTPLFSKRTKLGLLAEPFSRRRHRTTDLSMAEFIGAHFGHEIVDYALNPFVSGIYAGNAAKLCARLAFPKVWEAEQTHGSLLRGMIAQAKQRRAAGEPKTKIISFKAGLQSITDALARQLPGDTIELNAQVQALMQSPGSWNLIWSRNGETHTEEFAKIVLALPAASLAKLPFGALGERPLTALDSVEYPPVSSLFLGFRRSDVQHPLDGFGALVPTNERRKLLGVLFSSSCFPGRAPADHVALTVMAGGTFRADLAKLDQDELTAAVMPELRDLLGVTGAPVFSRFHTWPKAIPQYNLGYDRYLEAMANCEKKFPGVLIGGNVRDGIALNSCLLAGLKLAERAQI